MSFPTISIEEAHKLFTSGEFKYVDVRTKEEYADGHAPGSVCVPVLIKGTQTETAVAPDESEHFDVNEQRCQLADTFPPTAPDAAGAMVPNPEFRDLIQKTVGDKNAKLLVVRS